MRDGKSRAYTTPRKYILVIYKYANLVLGSTRNAHLINHMAKARALINDRDLLKSETERKK